MQIRTSNQQPRTNPKQLQTTNQQLHTRTAEELRQVQAQVAAGPSQSQIARWLGGYWGSTQFTLTGGAAADFVYDRQAGKNTYAVNFSPVVLYRLNDWLAFEGTFTAAFSPGSSGASFSSAGDTAQLFPHDYLGVGLGAFAHA